MVGLLLWVADRERGGPVDRFVPRLTVRRSGSELTSITLGHPLLDDYLVFVAARARSNTWLAIAWDLKVFFGGVPATSLGAIPRRCLRPRRRGGRRTGGACAGRAYAHPAPPRMARAPARTRRPARLWPHLPTRPAPPWRSAQPRPRRLRAPPHCLDQGMNPAPFQPSSTLLVSAPRVWRLPDG